MTPSFPKFLEPAFDARVLEQNESSIVVLDPAGRILWANPAWHRCAAAAGVALRSPDVAHGYYQGIAPPLREFYESVFARALANGEVFDQTYECSSPSERRVYRCRVLPIDGQGLVVEHSRVVDVDLDAVTIEAWTSTYVQASGVLHQCSHCERVQGPTPHAWDWMSPCAAQPPVPTSHVICPLCEHFFFGREP